MISYDKNRRLMWLYRKNIYIYILQNIYSYEIEISYFPRAKVKCSSASIGSIIIRFRTMKQFTAVG